MCNKARKRSPKTYQLEANPHELKFREAVLQTGEFSDVSFLIGDKTKRIFKAHRLILMAASETFKDMLIGQKEGKEIKISGIKPNNFEQLLNVIYLNRFELRSHLMAKECLKLFERHNLRDAVRKCHVDLARGKQTPKKPPQEKSAPVLIKVQPLTEESVPQPAEVKPGRRKRPAKKQPQDNSEPVLIKVKLLTEEPIDQLAEVKPGRRMQPAKKQPQEQRVREKSAARQKKVERFCQPTVLHGSDLPQKTEKPELTEGQQVTENAAPEMTEVPEVTEKTVSESTKGQPVTKNPAPQPKEVSKVSENPVSEPSEVELEEVGSFWRPMFLHKSDLRSEEEKATDELYRKLRAALNKLTNQNFDILSEEVKTLLTAKMNTYARLTGCAKLLFDKAVSEPIYSSMYAKFCKALAPISVQCDPNISLTFESILMIRSSDTLDRLIHTLDPNLSCDETDKIQACETQKRTIATMILFGEMKKSLEFSDSYLVTLRKIDELLEFPSNNSLECFCELWITCGKLITSDVESYLYDYGADSDDSDSYDDGSDLDKTFKRLEELRQNGSAIGLSNKTRFAIMDLVELRNDQWEPRRLGMIKKIQERTQQIDIEPIVAEPEDDLVQQMDKIQITDNK